VAAGEAGWLPFPLPAEPANGGAWPGAAPSGAEQTWPRHARQQQREQPGGDEQHSDGGGSNSGGGGGSGSGSGSSSRSGSGSGSSGSGSGGLPPLPLGHSQSMQQLLGAGDPAGAAAAAGLAWGRPRRGAHRRSGSDTVAILSRQDLSILSPLEEGPALPLPHTAAAARRGPAGSSGERGSPLSPSGIPPWGPPACGARPGGAPQASPPPPRPPLADAPEGGEEGPGGSGGEDGGSSGSSGGSSGSGNGDGVRSASPAHRSPASAAPHDAAVSGGGGGSSSGREQAADAAAQVGGAKPAAPPPPPPAPWRLSARVVGHEAGCTGGKEWVAYAIRVAAGGAGAGGRQAWYTVSRRWAGAQVWGRGRARL
jgi:hypothetical protein